MSYEILPSVPCGICGTPTTMTGTKRCERCWALERGIESNPELARKILADYDRAMLIDMIRNEIEAATGARS